MEILITLAALAALLALTGRLRWDNGDALLTRPLVEAALLRLGEKADAAGETVTLVVVGGAALMLGYGARSSTRDIDAAFERPPEARRIRAWAAEVAHELSLRDDWLNDGAKGWMHSPGGRLARGPQLLRARGIMVYQAPAEQLLAMKLMAWRQAQDQHDAAVVLREVQGRHRTRAAVWQALSAHLTLIDRLKAGYAFSELWDIYGDSSSE